LNPGGGPASRPNGVCEDSVESWRHTRWLTAKRNGRDGQCQIVCRGGRRLALRICEHRHNLANWSDKSIPTALRWSLHEAAALWRKERVATDRVQLRLQTTSGLNSTGSNERIRISAAIHSRSNTP
jgi:hypothetical protein